MRAKLLEQLTPEHELLTFFSSYMRDLINVITNLKDIVYQLIGIHTPDTKTHHISTDIHSVLLACNTGYEDLRRVQTLLKGHLKGKIVSQAIAESVRQSRKIQLTSSNRLTREDSKNNVDRINRNTLNYLHNRQRMEDQRYQGMNLKLNNQSRKIQSIDQYYHNRQDPQVRRLNSSKSQGQLLSKKYSKNTFSNQNAQLKSPLSLIDKIRNQLGIPANSK